MLLKLPQELLLCVADLLVIRSPARRADKNALKAMALTCRALLPIARLTLFRSLYVPTGTRADLIIAGLRAWTEARQRVVRELHVERKDQATKITCQLVLADVLSLLPCILALRIDNLVEAKLSPTLATALGRVDTISTLTISCGSPDAYDSGLFEFLSSLSPTVKLSALYIIIRPRPKPYQRILPTLPTVSTEKLCISDVFHIGDPKHDYIESVWSGLAGCCGPSLSVLDIPIWWIHPALLRAVSPTLRALRLNADWYGQAASILFASELQALFRESFPRLQALHLPFELALRITDFRPPMLVGVRVLVLSYPLQLESMSGPLQAVWDAISLARFELVVIMAAHFTSRPGLYPSRGSQTLQNAGTKVIRYDSVADPDLCVLLETGECV